jgi:hypothetical protein
VQPHPAGKIRAADMKSGEVLCKWKLVLRRWEPTPLFAATVK